MSDLGDRFRSLDNLSTPEQWSEITIRAERAAEPARISRFAVVGLAFAAVIATAFVGYQVIGGAISGTPNVGTGGASQAASASPTASPSPTPIADEVPCGPAECPDVGPLEPGTYTTIAWATTHCPSIPAFCQGWITFTVGAGWQHEKSTISYEYEARNIDTLTRVDEDPPSGPMVGFRTDDIQVYADPCHWAEGAADPGEGVVDFRKALEAKPWVLSEPVDRRWSGVPNVFAGYRGLSFELTVPAEFDATGCDEGQLRSWADHVLIPGQRDVIWAVDFDPGISEPGWGARLVVVGSYPPGVAPEVITQLDAILDSMELFDTG